MKRRVKYAAVPSVQNIDSKKDVTDKVHGADGRPIKLDVMVTRLAMDHPIHGHVKKKIGKVVRIYRNQDPRILVDFIDNVGRLHTSYADMLRRSQAKKPKFI